MAQFFTYPAVNISVPPGLATAANQVLEIADLDAIKLSTASIDSKLTSPVAVTGPLTDAELRASAVPVSAASLPLPTGAATEATLSSIDTKLTSPISVTGPLTDVQLRATPVPISGAVSTGGLTDAELRASPVDVSGPLTDVELRASAVPVSAASLPLPSGAATSANQSTANASLSSIDSKLTSPLAVTGPLTDTQLRATPVPVSGTVSTGGLTDAELRATPVAVSGPLTDTELRASAVPVSAASLPLPTGAATSANQSTANASLSSIDSKLTSPLTVTGPLTDTQLRATPVPVSGTVTITPSGTQDVNVTNASIAVTGTFFQATQPVSAVSLPLPTGAATSANQSTIISTLGSPFQAGGSIGNTSFGISGSLPAGANLIGSVKPSGLVKSNAPVYNDYTSTSVTTGAYVQLIASTSADTNVVKVFDSSGQAMILALGGSGSEVDTLYVPPGGDSFELAIPASTRVSYKALTGNAVAGYLLINLLG